MIDLIQARAMDEGDDGAKLAFGDPALGPIEVEGLGKFDTGQAWYDGSGMAMIQSGLADWATGPDEHDMLPAGTVILWYGNIGDIPEGWHATDGTGGAPNIPDPATGLHYIIRLP